MKKQQELMWHTSLKIKIHFWCRVHCWDVLGVDVSKALWCYGTMVLLHYGATWHYGTMEIR